MSSLPIDLSSLIETGLHEWLPAGHLRSAGRLNDSIRYAVFPGGKRMRPLLALLGAQLTGGCEKRALPAACATEFLHASSLVIDDLPAMDDAGIRRGRAALHLVYGEDLALLTALALLNQAYAIFSRSPGLVAEAAGCIGVEGMIGGQAADLELRGSGGSQEHRESRNRKTTALMRLTLTAGAIACDACPEDVFVLARCGEWLGEAYQIYDDLLDEFGCSEETGKPIHQDSRHGRPSHLAEYGVAASYFHAAALVNRVRASVCAQFGESIAVNRFLCAVDSVITGRSRTARLVSA